MLYVRCESQFDSKVHNSKVTNLTCSVDAEKDFQTMTGGKDELRTDSEFWRIF